MPLKLIKAGGKKLTGVKLFFIAKSKRILEIKRPRLIRIDYRYKSSLVFFFIIIIRCIILRTILRMQP